MMEKFDWHIRVAFMCMGLVALMGLIWIATEVAKNVAVVLCIANAASLETGSRTCGVAMTVFTLEEQIGGTNGE